MAVLTGGGRASAAVQERASVSQSPRRHAGHVTAGGPGGATVALREHDPQPPRPRHSVHAAAQGTQAHGSHGGYHTGTG